MYTIHVTEHAGLHHLVAPDGELLAMFQRPAEGKAQSICDKLNTFDALLSACEIALQDMNYVIGHHPAEWRLDVARTVCKEAIAKARG